MRAYNYLLAVASLLVTINAYWMGDISHQGLAPYAGSGYTVFRNVKDYGAKGDGSTDDTAAINAAITAGNRCGQGCASTTTTPAVVYFPAGTYLISSSIVPYYFTMLIGDANTPPTLKATSGFSGFGLIDGNPYYTSDLNWVSTNVFYRQIRNFVIDTTNIPAATAATGIHWPTSQATSLQNVVFQMPTSSDVVHVGLFIESGGSGGFMSDLTFIGGATGASMGNQQYTMRNFVFQNCKTAIIMLWDWGWTFSGLTISNCQVGIDISSLDGNGAQNVGSITVIDSTFTNVPVGIVTAYTSTSQPATGGSVILENIALSNVPVVVQSPTGTVLAGTTGTATITAWMEGHRYIPSGPTTYQGSISANSRPASLVSGNAYYTRSKPQYQSLSASDFVSVRSAGAVGNGDGDDTAAIQSAINSAVSQGKVVYIDHGVYRCTGTITIPSGAKIVGEAYPVLMSAGSLFSNAASPQPFIKVGATTGTAGTVELSDFVVSGQGAQPGVTLIEWNLASSGTPSGMWDVHTRVGGYTGSQLQVAQCPKTPSSSTVNSNCIAAYMSMHVTKSASNLYMENCWLWTADHDIDDASNTQITVYSGRGLLIESTAGNIWLVGTAVEHHVLYQYTLTGTTNIFASQLQTETPYYQPNPNALSPFTPNTANSDPDFSTCTDVSGNCAMAWGLRILDSSAIFIYGAGHYSFFDNYSTTCSTFSAGENCQARIVRLQGSVSNINIYNLNTIGSQSMIDQDNTQVAYYADNVNVYPSNVALYRSG
ncbi:Glucan 1,3-beta-glucosidase [Pleurostoma richardsiae]|uniref:Glucan 1,3-beta-glucosidase n=1 Tax=Pleurostoma richardsiae TaxID=41990 RepID=A0AA38S8D4_9PEZI|nr:Glucan 1,3-beta-glucosidase [Pleurostoma richardsiae]